MFSFNIFSQGSGIRTVVIDAGHGGKDGGCQGQHSQEKHIALSIALKLGKMIEENYKDVKVIYTRKTDVFVELSERASIANRNNADLFICVHVDAAESKSAYGTTSYVLGLHRTESQKKIAERENASIQFEENTTQYEDMSPDKLIARTLQLSAFLDQSITFAGKIQAEFSAIERKDRGVKQAGFIVLYRTTMPSVLIETGFLTNVSEEEFLRDDGNQQKMAKSIFNAFKEYKKERDGVDLAVSSGTDSNTQSNTQVHAQVEFKVQLATTSSSVDTKPYNFKGLSGVTMKKEDKFYKYYYGTSRTLEDAKKNQEKAINVGYKDAFIVSFLDGERISLKKAINLVEN